MLTTAMLINLAFLLPMPVSTEVPKVTAVEIVDLRRADLKPKSDDQPRFSFDRPGLKVVIEIQGEDVAKASHYGMLTFESATDNTGAKLKLNEDAFSFRDARTEFITIDRSQMFMGEKDAPKDVIRVDLPFESPARAAAAISLRGKLEVKKIATVELQVATTPGPVESAELKAAGAKLEIVKSDDDKVFAYKLTGKLDAVFEAIVTDAQGKPIETNGSSSSGGRESSTREIYLESPLPADAKLRIAVVTKSEVAAVKIELKDIKLP